MAFEIGAFNFDDLRGTVSLLSQVIHLEARTGQDGVAAFATGTRGTPFQLQSTFYAASWLLAVQLANNYKAAQSLALVNIVRETETYLATAYRFMILNVELPPIQSLVLWDGWRAAVRTQLSPAFRVDANWTLVAVDTSLAV